MEKFFLGLMEKFLGGPNYMVWVGKLFSVEVDMLLKKAEVL